MIKFTLSSFITFCLVSCASLNTPTETSSDKTLSKGLNKELTGYNYPFDVDYYEFQSQGQTLKMSYMDVGDKSHPVFVLLHGKNFTSAYFEDTIKFLLTKNLRVIAIDQLGFGKSSKPIHYQYTFQQLAYNTHQLLKHLDVANKYQLLGHSMGGMLAARYALMYPSEISRLYLLNPIGLEDWKTLVPYQTVDQGYETQLKTTNESIKNYQLKSYYDNVWKTQYDRWIEPLIGWNEGPDREHMAQIAALTSDMVITQPVIYELKNLKVPTVLMIGDRDRTAIGSNLVAPEVAKTMGRYDLLAPKIKKMIPKSQLIIFKNIGHLPHIEVPEKFQKELSRFL